jgi:hypothetical protein
MNLVVGPRLCRAEICLSRTLYLRRLCATKGHKPSRAQAGSNPPIGAVHGYVAGSLSSTLERPFGGLALVAHGGRDDRAPDQQRQ